MYIHIHIDSFLILLMYINLQEKTKHNIPDIIKNIMNLSYHLFDYLKMEKVTNH